MSIAKKYEGRAEDAMRALCAPGAEPKGEAVALWQDWEEGVTLVEFADGSVLRIDDWDAVAKDAVSL